LVPPPQRASPATAQVAWEFELAAGEIGFGVDFDCQTRSGWEARRQLVAPCALQHGCPTVGAFTADDRYPSPLIYAI
jgi:hypothetical protein